ncbi:hypothetical protein D3C75_931700 [compost metagenome]
MAVIVDRRRAHADHIDILLVEVGRFKRINLLEMIQILLMGFIGNTMQNIMVWPQIRVHQIKYPGGHRDQVRNGVQAASDKGIGWCGVHDSFPPLPVRSGRLGQYMNDTSIVVAISQHNQNILTT